MSFICGKETKLLNIKSVNVNDLSDISRVDLEANNQGLLICNSSGILRIISWINKKLQHKEKIIENVSDALWQQGGDTEVIVTCESGALLRYNLHYDTGITCSLQLSAPSVLHLIKGKDPNINSLKHLQICGHTKSYILLQPQADRLIVFDTNSGDRPNLVGVLKVPPVRTANLIDGKILVQPITGCELHIYNAATCKKTEIVSMTYPMCDTVYKEWGRLSCAPSGSFICLTDSERKLYIGLMSNKISNGKKGGLLQSSVSLNQIVWPSSIKPIFFCHFTITCSEDEISVFCSKFVDDKEESSYLLCKLKENRSLCSIHNFTEDIIIIPTLANDVQDFFLTNNGMSMLVDKDSSSGLANTVSDMKKLLASLEDAFDIRDLSKVAELKSTIEQDLSIFLSSCNYKDGWLEEAQIRCDQHSQLADMILSNLMSLSANPEDRSTTIVLKEMTEHHFKKLQEEMENALAYVDSKNVSQMLLQMVEQMRFFITNINNIKYPEDVKEEREILEIFENWKGKSAQEMVKHSLENGSVSTAQSYLQMKPWIYGNLTSDTLLSICLKIAQDNSSVELLYNLDKSYEPLVKSRLYNCRDISELRVLSSILRHWNTLDDQERISIHLIQGLLSTFPALIGQPLRFWCDLVFESEKKTDIIIRDLSVGVVRQWYPNTIMLLLCDLFARTNEPGIKSYVTSEALWHYFLLRSDEPMIRKWITSFFNYPEGSLDQFTISWTNDEILGVSNFLSESQFVPVAANKSERQGAIRSSRMTSDTQSLLGYSVYDSDAESGNSFSRSSLSGSIEDLSRISDISVPYLDVSWDESYFGTLNKNMIDLVGSVEPNFGQNLLNFLSQFNIFLSIEKTNLEDVFRRKIHSNLTTSATENQFKSTLTNQQISSMVLKKYASLRLYLPFYEYVRTNHVTTTDFELHLPEDEWFHLTNCFLNLTSIPSSETEFAAGTLSLEYLTTHKIEENCMLPALLTLVVSPYNTVEEFIKNDIPVASANDDTKRLYSSLKTLGLNPRSLLEQMSKFHPFLKGLIRSNPKTQLDITVYDLLRGNVTFDLSTLFTWQEKNNLGYNVKSQLPDFLDETLNATEGAKFSLDYIYYLQKGRPTKALFSAYEDIYQRNKFEKISDVEDRIYGLALSSWPDHRICSACVAFLFLSGSSCDLLRCLLHAADNVIQLLKRKQVRSFQRKISLVTQEIKEIFLQLCCKISRKAAASRLVFVIEETVVGDMVASEAAMRNSNSHEQPYQFEMPILDNKMFQLVNSLKVCNFFAYHYEIEPPQLILQAVARNNLWPVFLALIQAFQYPKTVILRLARQFTSVALKEHMSYALSNVHRYKGENFEIGRSKVVSCHDRVNLSSSVSSGSDRSCVSPSPNDSMADLFTIASTVNDDEWMPGQSQPDDLLSAFIACFRSADPVKALLNSAISFSSPVLSVLASCFAKADVNNCFIVYLYCILPSALSNKFHSRLAHRNSSRMDLAGLVAYENEFIIKKLIITYISNGMVDTLEESIRIFYKGHPFVNILVVFATIKSGRYPENGKSLFDTDGNCLKKYSPKNSALNKAAAELVCTGLDEYLPNNHMRKMFLNYFVGSSYANLVPINWSLIHGVYRLLERTCTVFKTIDVVLDLIANRGTLGGEKVINFFISIGDYSAATKIATLFDLKLDTIVVQQLRWEFDRVSTDQMELFFLRCQSTLRRQQVGAECAVQFFISLSERVADKHHEYLALSSALFWSKEEVFADVSQSTAVKEIERQMWLALMAFPDQLNTSPPMDFSTWPWESVSHIHNFDYDSLVSKTSVPVDALEDPILVEKARTLVDEFLKKDLLTTALRISNMFALEHKNARDLLTIIKSASKIKYSLSPFMLDQVEGFEIVSCATSSSDHPNVEASVKHPDMVASEIIQAVKNLCKDYHSNLGIKRNILTLCQVSELCSISFLDLVRCQSYEQILQYMLSQDKCDFELAKKFINTVPIASCDVENFLCKTVLSSLECENTNDSGSYGFSVYKLSNNWSNMIALIPNSTALGNRLLQVAGSYKQSSKDAYKAHSISVELIIYAHKCFQSSANIEGIGLLLNACRPLVNSMVRHAFWSLMGKLLIGLRRYNELHYIIDILKERGEFEHLLCKISDKNFKTSGLDRTLVHYLRCKYPEDRETLKLVAQHFLMHSDVAEMWETEAQELIDGVIDTAICTNGEDPDATNRVTRFFSYFSHPQERTVNGADGRGVEFLKAANSAALLEAMHCFSYAANCCLEGGMVMRALKLSRQAELIALQIALVRSAGNNGLALKIIQVPPSKLFHILSQYLSVREILLVSKAYDVNIDWVSALFHHFIIKGRQTFLSSFLQFSKLTSDIILGIVKRMEASNFEPENLANLSILLKNIDNPELVYRVASQFRMTETLKICLSSPSVDFLKDTTFKKGLSDCVSRRY